MPTKIVYSVSATATGGGRDGHTRTHDGALDLDLAPPKEMGGTGEGKNPEQLFSAGYAGCFLGALRAYAGQQKVKLADNTEITVTTGIGPREDGGFGLDVKIKASLPGIDDDTAHKLLAGAHHICPYSHATSGTLDVKTELA